MSLHYQIVSILIFQLLLSLCLFIYCIRELISIKKQFNRTTKLSEPTVKGTDIKVNYTRKNTNLS